MYAPGEASWRRCGKLGACCGCGVTRPAAVAVSAPAPEIRRLLAAGEETGRFERDDAEAGRLSGDGGG